jgi:putative ABC transport system permease protein
MNDEDVEGGILGYSLARLLKFCEELTPNPCTTDTTGTYIEDVTDAVASVYDPASGAADSRPVVNLLASADGLPNVVRMRVIRGRNMGAKEFDENFAMLHLRLAQRLMYGPEDQYASGIQLQLNHSSDMPVVRKRLLELFKENNLDLEIRTFGELMPQFVQVKAMFLTIFSFIAVVMAVVALFSIGNTMTMSVMERISEIGTLRSMGLRQSGVLVLFTLEGALLGFFGATMGLALGLLLATLINGAGLTWVPPTQVTSVPLLLIPWKDPGMVAGVWVGLLSAATLSAIAPAKRGANLAVVDALRHN